MIIDTFSSIDTFVPPYSGSKTLSPTFTLTGMMFPLWKLEQSLVKLKKMARVERVLLAFVLISF